MTNSTAQNDEAAEHKKGANLVASMTGVATASLSTNNDNFEPQIGYVDAKGWRYAGLSRTTKTRLWVANEDSGNISWYGAVQLTQKLTDFQGYKGSETNKQLPLAGTGKEIEEVLQLEDDGGVRLPTRNELNQMFLEQKALGDNFGSTDHMYWSSSELNAECAYSRTFSECGQSDGYKDFVSSVRLVRSEKPQPKLQA